MMYIPEVCEECGLHKEGCESPLMPGYGSDNPKILFAGEAPGKTEDLQNRPFVGKAGQWLANAIDTIELAADEYRLTNVVRCRPPNNRTPRAKEIQYCSQYLVDEIAEYKPDVVVLLGNVPLKAVLGESGITTWNGVVVERDGITYVPAFHPSFFNYGNREYLEEWLKALMTAVEVIDGKEVAPDDGDYGYIFPSTMDDLQEMVGEISVFNGVVSYDVEAQYLEPGKQGNRILSFSLGIDGVSWSVPLHHDAAEWSSAEAYEIIALLSEILQSKKIIGHNIRFDSKITRELLGIDFKPHGDTMLISQLMNSRKGIHGLKRLAGLHLGMFDYDKELQDHIAEHPECDYDKGGHYGNVPLDVLLPYGGKDAAATWMLYQTLYDELDDAQKILYHQLIMQADYELGIMEANGFKLDKHVCRRYRFIYEDMKQLYYDAILEDDAVKKYVEFRQLGRHISKKIAKRYKSVWAKAKKPNKFVQAVLAQDEVSLDLKYKFNPNSSDQVSDVFYVFKGHAVPGHTDSGKPSVKADLIKNSSVADDPIYEDFRLWKLMASMLSKYLYPAELGKWDVGDGRARTNFNIGGTKTGRLSSSKPVNFQNIPTPEKEPGTLLAQLPIKNIFTHTHPGGCLCAVDYGSMELRVMASISNCPGMIQVFKDGKDPHCYVTKMVFPDIVPADATDKEVKRDFLEYRYRAKWTNWTLLFGGDEGTLYRLYGLPKDEASAIVKAYYGRFPEILDFQESTKDFAKSTGYVESVFGRRLYLPYINDNDRVRAADATRTAVNMPIQSPASDVLLCAIVVLGHKMRELNMRTMLVNTVHDSKVADVYPGELDTFTELAVDVMENIVSYAPSYFPGLNWDWLKVPLVADVEVGSHYGALEHYHLSKVLRVGGADIILS